MSNIETVKCVLLGESSVGKTSIINQFTENMFDADVVSNSTAQFVTKIVEYDEFKKALKFEIWDTAGQERFRSLAKIFYKDAKVVILVYDITNIESFNQLKEYWYDQVRSNGDKDAIISIVANKNDLYNEQQVKNEEGEKFAAEIKGIFQSTSAKSDIGITTLFDNIGKKYFNPDYDCGEVEKKLQEEYQQKKSEEKQRKIEKEPKGVRISIKNSKKKKKKKFC